MIAKEWRNNQGCCNAYLAASKNKEDLDTRIQDIPEELRVGAKRHCQLVWIMNKRNEKRLKMITSRKIFNEAKYYDKQKHIYLNDLPEGYSEKNGVISCVAP